MSPFPLTSPCGSPSTTRLDPVPTTTAESNIERLTVRTPSLRGRAARDAMGTSSVLSLIAYYFYPFHLRSHQRLAISMRLISPPEGEGQPPPRRLRPRTSPSPQASTSPPSRALICAISRPNCSGPGGSRRAGRARNEPSLPDCRRPTHSSSP